MPVTKNKPVSTSRNLQIKKDKELPADNFRLHERLVKAAPGVTPTRQLQKDFALHKSISNHMMKYDANGQLKPHHRIIRQPKVFNGHSTSRNLQTSVAASTANLTSGLAMPKIPIKAAATKPLRLNRKVLNRSGD